MTGHEQPDPGAYDFDLWVKLETTIDMYEQDREQYWAKRLDAEDWTPDKQLRQDSDEIARLIRKRAFALQGLGTPAELNGIYEAIQKAKEILASILCRDPNTIPDTEIDVVLKDGLFKLLSETEDKADGRGSNISNAPIKLIWERLWIDDAWNVVSGIQERAYRVWELERLIERVFRSQQPPEPSARFLALVSRCYVFGFIIECVAMCRAAMEQALRDRVTVESPSKAKQPDTLDGMINTAFAQTSDIVGWDPELYKAAKAVQERGNEALHNAPDATNDALGTIESALRVIAALYPVSS